MFSLFFFFSDVGGKNKQDKQIQISYVLLDCFFTSNGHTRIGPRFVFSYTKIVYSYTNEQVMNERGCLIEIEASELFRIFVEQPQPRCSEFHTGGSNVFHLPPTALLFLSFFFLSGGWSRANSGAIQYLYVSFCLVSTAKGGGLSCVWFATAAIQFQLLKRWGPFEQSHLFEWAVLLSDKLDPSTSLMCPVGDGGSLCACACVCLVEAETGREIKKNGYKFCSANIVIYHHRDYITDVAVTAELKGFSLYESTMIIE